MIKLTLLIFLFTILASGYLQEVSNSLSDLPTDTDITGSATKQLWLQQFQGRRRNKKPCHRRSNSNPDGSWIPSYSSLVSHPLYEPTALQPQALKNEEYKETQVSATTENFEKILISGLTSNNPAPADDCGDQLGAIKLGSTDSYVEKTALKVIEDCLKKKKNNQDAFAPSRRSFSDPDSTHNDENDYPRDSEIEESRDGNKVDDTRDAIKNIGSSNKNSPEEGTGFTSSGNSLQNLRVCYACSTATNPTCWEPDKRTTIKYCRKEHSCVTKTFGVKNQVTLIRDCANSCADTSVPGIEPKYKTCKVCHDDYCNSAMSIALNGYNLYIVLIISIVKYAH